MESSLSFDQETFIAASEVPSSTILLERGIYCIRRGCCVEGAIYFARAREQLSPDQVDLAVALDTFIRSQACYLKAQQALHIACKRLIEADTEQQTQLVALEKWLLLLKEEEMERVSQLHTTVQPIRNSSNWQKLQLSESLSTDSNTESPPMSSPTEDYNALPALYFTCFGRFEVMRSGQLLPLCSSRKGQTILRYLVAQLEHRATIDVLMTLLWPQDESEVAKSKLHTAISALRHSLNHGYNCNPGCGYIVCKNRVYSLNPAVVIRTDVDEFLECSQAETQTSEEKLALYEKACSIYTGPFLSEDMYEDWSFLQREQLTQIYLTMCRVLADHYLQIKHYENAAKWATAILKVNRCDEGAHRQLIQVYAAQGHRSEALQQYRRCESVLHEELGVTPSPETIEYFRRALRQ